QSRRDCDFIGLIFEFFFAWSMHEPIWPHHFLRIIVRNGTHVKRVTEAAWPPARGLLPILRFKRSEQRAMIGRDSPIWLCEHVGFMADPLPRHSGTKQDIVDPRVAVFFGIIMRP